MRGFLLLLALVATTTISSAQFEIIIQFTGMTPHVNQMLGIRVTERESGLEAAKVIMPKIKEADFEVRILCGRADIDYNLDFFADLNGNGMYDAPPTDHAWRELVGIINNHALVEFQHNTNFTDINWPNPQDPLPSVVIREYAGAWHNNTFETEGDATASFTKNYDEGTASGTITTSGAFGIPTPLTINGAGPYFPETDSMALSLQAPLSGVIFFVRGEVAGIILHPTLGVNMSVSGNYGDDQLMLTYEMSGNFQADGYFSMQTTQTTDVHDEEEESDAGLTLNPNPATDVVHIHWHEEDGEPEKLFLVNMAGLSVVQPRVVETDEGTAEVNVESISSGSYLLVLELQHRTVVQSLIIER